MQDVALQPPANLNKVSNHQPVNQSQLRSPVAVKTNQALPAVSIPTTLQYVFQSVIPPLFSSQPFFLAQISDTELLGYIKCFYRCFK